MNTDPLRCSSFVPYWTWLLSFCGMHFPLGPHVPATRLSGAISRAEPWFICISVMILLSLCPPCLCGESTFSEGCYDLRVATVATNEDGLSYIQFLGAAGVVTGSKHLIHVDNNGARPLQVLVDCGLFQGQKEWRERNWQDLPVPANVD